VHLETIHEDERGTISLLHGFQTYEEATMFTTKDGYARGGCVHLDSDEFLCVLEGSICFVYGIGSAEVRLQLNAGNTFKIKANTPHYFISSGDSIVMEWGPKVEEKNNRYAPFREKVDIINREHK
jgi:mannose-6-phosphate isomerase-like protein (cupin superfamily)